MSSAKTRVLFICKIGDYDHRQVTVDEHRITGLRNSARFCHEILLKAGIESRTCIVRDNNDIDRHVDNYKPTHVIIEALWVVPEKFQTLNRLHPHVKWIVRLHSEVPFLSLEGIAVDWIIRYLSYPNVWVSGNSQKLYRDIVDLINLAYPNKPSIEERIVYLPNCYTIADTVTRKSRRNRDEVHIGCFGAIRPFKNQLSQAIAAIRFAEYLDRPLRFHMNGTRIEQNGESIQRNIVKLFQDCPYHQLIFHPWMDHCDFMKLLAEMDMGLQVSLTESFNIVSADMVASGIPIVVSPQVYWSSALFHADPTDVDNIVDVMKFAWRMSTFGVHNLNKRSLNRHMDHASTTWVNYFRK